MRDAAAKAKRGSARRSTNVRWWQAVSAVVPITLVAGAWGVAITASPEPENVDAQVDDTPSANTETPGDTDVPANPFAKPEAGKVKDDQSGRDPLSDVDANKNNNQTLSASLKNSPLPTPALDAYRDAADVMGHVKASCNLDWTLVAAIGRVESDHGQYGGSTVDSSGFSTPRIIGIPLDGTNETAAISDTDNGKFDGDTRWDRAVGPMQFIPSTWDLVGVDGNNDGTKDPNNIYDAALATSVYLCADGDDLSTKPGASQAVFSYNHSTDYVANVLAIANRYRHGDFSEAPITAPETNSVPEGTTYDPYSEPEDTTPTEPKHADRPKLKAMQKETTKKKNDRATRQVEPADGTGEGKISKMEIEEFRRDGHAIMPEVGDDHDGRPKNDGKPKNDSKPDGKDYSNHDADGVGDGKLPDDRAQDSESKDSPKHKADGGPRTELPKDDDQDGKPKHRADVEPDSDGTQQSDSNDESGDEAGDQAGDERGDSSGDQAGDENLKGPNAQAETDDGAQEGSLTQAPPKDEAKPGDEEQAAPKDQPAPKDRPAPDQAAPKVHAQLVPKDQAAPKDQAVPKDQAAPEQAAPKDRPAPDQATPKDQAVPKDQAAPEQAAPKDRPAPDQAAPKVHAQLVPKDQAEPKAHAGPRRDGRLRAGIDETSPTALSVRPQAQTPAVLVAQFLTSYTTFWSVPSDSLDVL